LASSSSVKVVSISHIVSVSEEQQQVEEHRAAELVGELASSVFSLMMSLML
jgi:hypothetical protein